MTPSCRYNLNSHVTLAQLPTCMLLLALAAAAANAQTPVPAPATITSTTPHKPRPRPSQPSFNPNVILLDPSHGGSDDGAHLSDTALEKDATLAFATQLRTLLTARGFTVILTHDSASNDVASDARTDAANRSHAVACLLLHASNGGHGVHLYTSALPAAAPAIPDTADSHTILPWDTAQAASIPRSLALSGEISNVLYSSRIPLVVGRASVPPIDSLSCPAVVLELAPLLNPGEDPTAASDAGYQQRTAEALTSALVSWRTKMIASIAAAPPPAPPAKLPLKPAAPTLKPKSIPIETPDVITPAPAPIVRRPPPAAPQSVTPNPSGGPPQ